MDTKILSLQTKGQIMLPKQWRDELGADVYQAIKDGDIIILKPIKACSDREVLEAADKVIKKHKKLLERLS